MNSTDPIDPWTQAVRRQRHKMIIAMVVGLTIPAIIIVAVWFMFRQIPATPRGFLWPLLLVVPVLAAIAFAIYKFTRQQRGLMKLVPSAGGLVCPKCRIALPAEAEQEPEACPQCGRRYARQELRQFWETVIRDPMAANRWWIDHHADQGVRGRLTRVLFGRFRENPWLIVALNVCIWGGAGAIFAAVQGASVVLGLFTFTHMMLFMTGFSLIVAARRRNISGSRHCAACNYERGPGSAGPDRCPECGLDWNAIGGTVHGRVNHRPGLIVFGAAMIALAVMTMVAPLVARGWQNKVMPTGLLIQNIIDAPRGFTIDEWSELNARTLTREQVLRLAEGLLDRRLNRGYLSPNEDAWLAKQTAAGVLPPELAERHFREMLDLWIVAPEQARVGQALTLGIGARIRFGASAGPLVYVGGFFIDDDPEPRQRQDRSIPGLMLGMERYQFDRMSPSAGYSPEVTITPERAGSIRVRLKAWLVVFPAKVAGGPITWLPDGSPLIQPIASWSTAVELERTIPVVP